MVFFVAAKYTLQHNKPPSTATSIPLSAVMSSFVRFSKVMYTRAVNTKGVKTFRSSSLLKNLQNVVSLSLKLFLRHRFSMVVA